jgi:hypothetical protein
MPSPDPQEVEGILADLDRQEPTDVDLGTPQLQVVDAVDRLVALGPAVVPLLLERLRDQAASRQRIGYLVMALGILDDVRAMPTLRELRQAYRHRELPDEWDHVVIGQCDVALERLERAGRLG